MKNKKVLGLLGFITLGIVGIGFFVLNQNNSDTKKEETTTTVEERKETKATSTSSSKEEELKEEEFTREGSVKAVTEILTELEKSPKDGMSLEDRLKEVSKEKYDKKIVFTDKGWDKIYLPDFLSVDPRGEVLAAQSLLSVLNTVDKSKETRKTDKIQAADVELSDVVLFDEKAKSAQVPVDLFTEVPTSLSFEVLYIDGEWVIQPYSLITQIAIRTMEQALINSTPEGTKVMDEEQLKKIKEEVDKSTEESESTKNSTKKSDTKSDDKKSEDKKTKDKKNN